MVDGQKDTGGPGGAVPRLLGGNGHRRPPLFLDFEGRWTFKAKEYLPVHYLGGTAYAVAGFLAEAKRQGDRWTVVEKAAPDAGRF